MEKQATQSVCLRHAYSRSKSCGLPQATTPDAVFRLRSITEHTEKRNREDFCVSLGIFFYLELPHYTK